MPDKPTIHDLHQVLDARWLGPASAFAQAATRPVGRVVTDSRKIEEGDVVWALRGPNHDGARFADEAFERGAAGAVLHRTAIVPEGRWALEVPDTNRALRRWAAWHRGRFSGTVVAITGSVGKTTTRQMIDTVLRQKHRGSASPRNYNNHVGVPLSMLQMEPGHDYAVLELGASSRGEIARLAALCRPHIGVITHVGDAHLGGFGSRRGIAEAKAELLDSLPPEGHAVLGADPWLSKVAGGCRAEVTWVGCDDHCHLMATDLQADGGKLRFRLGRTEVAIPVWGRHHLTAALAAVAVGNVFGVPLDEMADALSQFDPVPMRCEVVQVRGATWINDAYNASPTAMRAALELLRDFEGAGRRVVVSGDMVELGSQAPLLHARLGNQVATIGKADLLIACGEFAGEVVAGARAAGMTAGRAFACATAEEALPYLGQAVMPGDVVLLKGSRAMAMERIIEAMQRYPQRRSA